MRPPPTNRCWEKSTRVSAVDVEGVVPVFCKGQYRWLAFLTMQSLNVPSLPPCTPTGLVALYERVEMMVNELYHRCRDWPVFLSFMLNMIFLAMRGTSSTVTREQAYSLIGYVVHTYMWEPVLSNWYKGNWDFGLDPTPRNKQNADMVCVCVCLCVLPGLHIFTICRRFPLSLWWKLRSWGEVVHVWDCEYPSSLPPGLACHDQAHGVCRGSASSCGWGVVPSIARVHQSCHPCPAKDTMQPGIHDL